ncbi:conserved domain protein [delta proteobacterium NaphS2]|nr:conserved domain protein [delta proteobacterium NaphS2]
MAKKRGNQSKRILVEAIGYIKTIQKTAPENPKIAEILEKAEKNLQDQLFDVMSREVTSVTKKT